MSTPAEIEAAVERLPEDERQQLLLSLASRFYRPSADLPPPRDIPWQKIQEWIKEDEEGHRQFLAGRLN